uniref:Keratinocyte differentiation associated protein n=1 Tax=Ornithorhynchus anatinus TaxID=9258 RepID=F6U9A1_ORNAN
MPKMTRIMVIVAWCVLQAESRHPDTPAANPHDNFLDDDRWLSTVSQYDKNKYWNKFRDDDYFRNWNPNKPFDQALDPAKDPCLKVKCSPHKVNDLGMSLPFLNNSSGCLSTSAPNKNSSL